MYMGVTHNVENRMESAVGETDPANRRTLLAGSGDKPEASSAP